jgi:hypothetical protein
MNSSDTQSLHTLTDKKMAILVVVALEEFGAELTRTKFNELMLAIFEHIPGFETLPRRCGVQYRKVQWLKYQQAI